MLRIAAGKATPLRVSQARGYAEGGFQISDYLSRIEAITKNHKPQARTPRTLGKSSSGAQNKQRPQRQQKRPQDSHTQTRSPKAASSASSTQQSGNGAPRTEQPPRRPSAQKPGLRRSPRTGSQQATSARPAVAEKTSESTAAEGFTSLSAVSQTPLPKSNRRTAAAPRGRARSSRSPRTRRTDGGAAAQRRSLQVSDLDTSFLRPKEALEILMRNQNTTPNGFITVGDVSLQSLQGNMVQSAVSFNARVRSLLGNLPEDVVADRERLRALVRKHVEGSYEGSVVAAKNQNDVSQSLVNVLNANPSFTGDTKRFFANIGNGKVPIKQIAKGI